MTELPVFIRIDNEEDIDKWILIEDVTENPFILNGLTYNIEYEVQIQAICGDNVSDWSASSIFTPTKGTGMGELNADGKQAVKFMENGVLYIILDGVKYNAQGAKIQ